MASPHTDASLLRDVWWKNAVVYCLDVETYMDADGDGIGDLEGLLERLDHIAGLGATCVWLMPFYPTPNRDDGYDVTDFYSVDPHLGTLGDLVELIRAAHEVGLRVVVDLVVNHTSDQHPWFQEARRDRDGPHRDFYVWRDERPEDPGNPVFPDAENSIWSYDDEAGAWYLHHFYRHQPDLNLDNPRVRGEIAKIVGFWLELGVDGFRMDAVPYVIEDGTGVEPPAGDPHRLLRDIRAFSGRRRGDSVLLGEVNLPSEQALEYFGEGGTQLQLLFNFTVMQATYLALARQDAGPLVRALEELPVPPPDCHWANFLRNHDELTLDQLTEDERQEVFDAFGPDPDMQLYGRGLRRRLAPMLDGDPVRLRLAYSLLFSLPGVPVLFYGEEIGMGENLEEPGRLSVRTPMQWAPDERGGFSSAPVEDLRRRLPEGPFGPGQVNVLDQRSDPGSLLGWMQRLVRRRRETPELGWGNLRLVESGARSVLAHAVDGDARSVLAVHNLGDRPVTVELHSGRHGCEARDLLAEHSGEPMQDGELRLELGPYDRRWYRIQGEGPTAP